MNQGRIIVITGSPGTGKTTTASIVAKESNMDKSVHAVQYRKDHPELPLRKAAENLGVSLNTVEKRKEIING